MTLPVSAGNGSQERLPYLADLLFQHLLEDDKTNMINAAEHTEAQSLYVLFFGALRGMQRKAILPQMQEAILKREKNPAHPRLLNRAGECYCMKRIRVLYSCSDGSLGK